MTVIFVNKDTLITDSAASFEGFPSHVRKLNQLTLKGFDNDVLVCCCGDPNIESEIVNAYNNDINFISDIRNTIAFCYDPVGEQSYRFVANTGSKPQLVPIYGETISVWGDGGHPFAAASAALGALIDRCPETELDGPVFQSLFEAIWLDDSSRSAGEVVYYGYSNGPVISDAECSPHLMSGSSPVEVGSDDLLFDLMLKTGINTRKLVSKPGSSSRRSRTTARCAHLDKGNDEQRE